MNYIPTKFRMRNSKKGVTPVIATIILIAGTLVLALVVGAYTFGLFGSNVKQIQLNSAILTGGSATSPTLAGTATFQVVFNNPGGVTNVTSVTLSAGSTSITLITMCTANNACGVPITDAKLASGQVTGFQAPYVNVGSSYQPGEWYPNSAINSGSTYNYVINFANGQSISGSIIAQ
jgi:flagellin-like protein